MNNKEKWLKLYEIADKIKKLEPWKYLWDIDILSYLSPNQKEIFYFNILGRNGIEKAIIVYKGEKISTYLDALENGYLPYMLTNYHECLACEYISRDETMPENRKIIKELGLKFRGTWTSFEKFEKGYEPTTLNKYDLDSLLDVFENLYEMLKILIEEKVNVDFENDQMYVRFYDENTKSYINAPEKCMLPSIVYDVIKVPKEFEKLVADIPKRDYELEFDFLNFLPIRILELKEKDGRRYYPLSRCLLERGAANLYSPEFIDKNDYETKEDYVKESVELFINYVCRFGRPATLYVRDEETKAYLEDFARVAKIKIKVTPRLKTIDRIYGEIMTNM